MEFKLPQKKKLKKADWTERNFITAVMKRPSRFVECYWSERICTQFATNTNIVQLLWSFLLQRREIGFKKTALRNCLTFHGQKQHLDVYDAVRWSTRDAWWRKLLRQIRNIYAIIDFQWTLFSSHGNGIHMIRIIVDDHKGKLRQSIRRYSKYLRTLQ